MIHSLALLVFCSGKILMEEWAGSDNPSAGFCGGPTGWECIPCSDDPADRLERLLAEQRTLQTRINAVKLEVKSVMSEVTATVHPDFSFWYGALDAADAIDIYSGERQRELHYLAGVKVPDSATTALETKRTPPPIKTMEDGRRILFDESQVMGTPEEVEGCVDLNENCTWWAEIGECVNNPGFIMKNCPKACSSCRLKLPAWKRCARRPDAIPLVTAPHGLSNLIKDILENETISARYETKVLSKDPWILQFENFATIDHWNQIEAMVEDEFEGSTVVGPDSKKGTIGRQFLGDRTSTNAWCGSKPCVDSWAHVDLQNRLAELLKTTPAYMEALQVLRYEEGQEYKSHHDVIENHMWMMPGPRVFTAFIYFNEVAEGGETDFNLLGVKVKPKLGRMVLWPSVKDADSFLQDERTHHAAVKVVKGFKRAANLWVHLHDWNTPVALGCDGHD
eukprot:m.461099 g.461099  ORF g.461099 m.461099 type:complete len:451 (-) comp22205_c0_seq1:54-1406(-)